MFKLYYASAIDCCVEQAFKQIEEFKELFSKYTKSNLLCYPTVVKDDSLAGVHIEVKMGIGVKHPIEVYGAGFGDSPIIGPETSSLYKGVISAYDLRKLRESDMLLIVTNLKQFCFGTAMEMEYARQLGLYIIVLVLGEEKVKNIFIETFADKVIYSTNELEDILRDITQ